MRLQTREQSRALDQEMDLEMLVESAGLAFTQYFAQFVSAEKNISILIGPGNNGIDGLVIARLLKSKNFIAVHGWILFPDHKRSSLWQKKFLQAKAAGVVFKNSDADIFVDAIFGTGLNKDIPEKLQAFFEKIHRSRKKVFAVDCPSGLDVDSGHVRGQALKANHTVTFGLAKPGFFAEDGPSRVGYLRVEKILFSTELLRKVCPTHFAFGSKAAKRWLPQRTQAGYKSLYGQVQVFAGSKSFPGAAILCSRAAARMGAGYVKLSSSAKLADIVVQIPEVIFQGSKIAIEKESAQVVGPGLGTGKFTAQIFKQLQSSGAKKVVLDADALNFYALHGKKKLDRNWIVTPHVGELARLLGTTTKEITKNRFAAAKKASQKLGCVVLLKGFRTIVSDGNQVFVILSGNVALAKAGSGDVLCGFIGALLAQGIPSFWAACLGAYVHGKLADDWLKSGRDVLSLVPSDLDSMLPETIHSIRTFSGSST